MLYYHVHVQTQQDKEYFDYDTLYELVLNLFERAQDGAQEIISTGVF